ncbi:MAG: hypothetical protein AAFR38_14365 [Planctomycetota bacterium]
MRTSLISAVNRAARRGLIAATLALAAGGALAEDVVVLKDGTRVSGTITRELAGAVWITVTVGGIEQSRFIAPNDVKEIIRDSEAAPESGAAGEGEPEPRALPSPAEDEAETQRAFAPGTPKGIVVTLEGGVGDSFTAKQLRGLVPSIENEIGADSGGVLVLKINSGGGFGFEIGRMNEVIAELQGEFNVFVWIESAISAAAMSVHGVDSDHMIFMPEGNYGACTGWSGNSEAVEGLPYYEMVVYMEEVSAKGGHDPDIMLAMQGDPEGETPLSVSRDAETGEVRWYSSETEGEYLLNPGGEVFTFNSQQAVEWGFARAVAGEMDELTDVITEVLGYDEIEWIGDELPGIVHPVSRTEAENRRWRERIDEENGAFQVAVFRYNMAANAANGAQDEVRRRYVGRARQHLGRINRLVSENPNFAIYLPVRQIREYNEEQLLFAYEEWYRAQREFLRDLLRVED